MAPDARPDLVHDSIRAKDDEGAGARRDVHGRGVLGDVPAADGSSDGGLPPRDLRQEIQPQRAAVGLVQVVEVVNERQHAAEVVRPPVAVAVVD
eukprot:CAMPEP_0119386792 /NCGR_PEP_ID=MMETSP1334-20130426/97701_1 /TAXON_ID=127549 /ORGANISM="Calcidiscus leptoporus, Strain RCC1130" /LENGTH=93 /DNA_ID=CAMNT_0007408363 /DNA_START=59 /DNA_END=337 /DNA_ORIENTATION=+